MPILNHKRDPNPNPILASFWHIRIMFRCDYVVHHFGYMVGH